MFNVNKEIKKMDAQQAAQEQLNKLIATERSVDKMINEFCADAKERLLDNDESGFELVANSVFYFQDIKKIVQTIRIQFQTYTRTAQFMDTIEGLRPVLRKTAEMMNNMPGLDNGNKDLIKFKKGLMKGQLNMNAMSSMMTCVNPSSAVMRTREEFEGLKERLLIPQTPYSSAPSAPAGPSVIDDNADFFDAIDGDKF